jgi:hypothetical protein
MTPSLKVKRNVVYDKYAARSNRSSGAVDIQWVMRTDALVWWDTLGALGGAIGPPSADPPPA